MAERRLKGNEARHKGVLWAGPYGLDEDDEQVRHRFYFQHGYLPEKIMSFGGGKLAGPIREMESETRVDP